MATAKCKTCFLTQLSCCCSPLIDEPAPVDHEEYLRSEAWRGRKALKVRLPGRKCERCGSRKGLQVDHLTNERLGHEEMADLVVLCGDCYEDDCWIDPNISAHLDAITRIPLHPTTHPEE